MLTMKIRTMPDQATSNTRAMRCVACGRPEPARIHWIRALPCCSDCAEDVAREMEEES